MKNTALITGASTGLGREFAKLHAQQKGDLIVVARSIDKLQSLKVELENQYDVEVRVIAKDLSQINSANEVYNQVREWGVYIDYLINNAGFGGVGKFHERPWEQDLSMINLNITTLTALTRLFLPDMVKRNQGRILNVSSTASLLPGPLQAVYFATKAYVTSFSNALAEELSDTKVTVTALLPGATETEFGATSGMDKTSLFDKLATASSVAKDGYNGMLTGKLDVISGVRFSQKLLMSTIPFTPKKMVLKQMRKMQEIK
ncbi:SDR family NAD(P)-dependent oxidoreductase [Reichenbachiella versicolor]|uniref:SDR family NAD(P)-dependent oxidoreductase n=1 Tax=Reichenbachiella versicolor TaxID=1821036 RepID=UPI000D6E41FE|nr:SDR family oxidoreductase [Reichenbachiella versicolor]